MCRCVFKASGQLFRVPWSIKFGHFPDTWRRQFVSYSLLSKLSDTRFLSLIQSVIMKLTRQGDKTKAGWGGEGGRKLIISPSPWLRGRTLPIAGTHRDPLHWAIWCVCVLKQFTTEEPIMMMISKLSGGAAAAPLFVSKTRHGNYGHFKFSYYTLDSLATKFYC